MLNKAVKLIKKLIFNIRLRWAVREAKANARLYNRRFMVIQFNGKPMVISKRDLKTLIARKFFIKGTTMEQLEKKAWYISDTYLQNTSYKIK
jgi:hypothetical protein